jgi:hypothetical protein
MRIITGNYIIAAIFLSTTTFGVLGCWGVCVYRRTIATWYICRYADESKMQDLERGLRRGPTSRGRGERTRGRGTTTRGRAQGGNKTGNGPTDAEQARPLMAPSPDGGAIGPAVTPTAGPAAGLTAGLTAGRGGIRVDRDAARRVSNGWVHATGK